MRRAANKHNKTPMPFVWDIARYCLELPYGQVRHFPAGTFNEQVSTWAGQVELSLMETAHSAWYMFERMSPGDWGEGERRFAKWMSDNPKPKPKPTRTVDRILRRLWGASPWAAYILEQMRPKDA